VQGLSVIGPNECKTSMNCSVCDRKFNLTRRPLICPECTLSVCKDHIRNAVGKKRVCDFCYKEHLAAEAEKELDKARSLEFLEIRVETRISEQEQWQEMNADIDSSIVRCREQIRAKREEYSNELQSLRQALMQERNKNERLVSVMFNLQQAGEESQKYATVTEENYKAAAIAVSVLKTEHEFLLGQRDTLQHQAFTLHYKISNQINFTQVFLTCCRNCKKKFAHSFNKELIKANFTDTMSFITNSSVAKPRRSSEQHPLKSEYCKCSLM